MITLNCPNLIVGADRGNQFLVDGFQSDVPVDRSFARSQQIQVWAVKHQNFGHEQISCRMCRDLTAAVRRRSCGGYFVVILSQPVLTPALRAQTVLPGRR